MSTLILLKTLTSGCARRHGSLPNNIPITGGSKFTCCFATAIPPRRQPSFSLRDKQRAIYQMNRRHTSTELESKPTTLFYSSSPSNSTNVPTTSASIGAIIAATCTAVVANNSSQVLCHGDENNSETTNAAYPNNSIDDSATTSPNCNSRMPFPDESLKTDHYNGITLDVSRLPNKFTSTPAFFEEILIQALDIWIKEGKRGIWVKIPKQYSALIPHCIDQGFDFQLAEKGRVILTRWLPSNTPSRLPLGPTHQIGIGAILLHPFDSTKMLVVKEKSGPAAAYDLWKMPTGLSDPGEDITEAVIREMKEETGLHCVFRKIACFRQAHGIGSYGTSDLFFVCVVGLDPIHYDLTNPNVEIPLQPQEEEIAMISWMDIKEFTEQERFNNSPLYATMNKVSLEVAKDIQLRNQNGSDDSNEINTEASDDSTLGLTAKALTYGYRPGANTLYLSSL